jgi:two-component system cell cycle sensor histidine kinase/response regulator CckA
MVGGDVASEISAVGGAVVGALAGLALSYRAAARITRRQVFDRAAGPAEGMAELKRRFDEVQRLHAETEASHRSLRDEMRRRETAEAALIEAQKLEAVGRLSGGVAHDFNNILTVILGSTAYAKASLDSPGELAASLDAIEGAARRASDLTKRLLAFARRQVVTPRVVSIDEQLRQLERMARSLVGEAVTVQYRLDAETARVLIDPTQLEQVLMNLTVNARDAMPRGGSLSFESTVVDLRAADPALAPGLAAGLYVRLEVSDTGHGMDEVTLRRAFEPFFTTKDPGRGTGLGLATCHGIVVQAGGAIAARSAPGVGTTFTVHLPRLAAVAQEVAPPRPAIRGGGETVLVVEDDTEVRAVVVRTLTDAGYDVLQAANGAHALETVAAASRRIHLLVTDVVMDGGDGRELAERLRSGLGALPVLFVSGYPYEVLSRHGVLEEGLALLSKPFAAEDLLAKVRGVLDDA